MILSNSAYSRISQDFTGNKERKKRSVSKKKSPITSKD